MYEYYKYYIINLHLFINNYNKHLIIIIMINIINYVCNQFIIFKY